MRVTIVPADGLVMINELAYDKLDLSFIDSSIHAVQWDGVAGEVERKNPATGKLIANEQITSLDAFQEAIAKWHIAKQQHEAFVAAQEATKAAAASTTTS